MPQNHTLVTIHPKLNFNHTLNHALQSKPLNLTDISKLKGVNKVIKLKETTKHNKT